MSPLQENLVLNFGAFIARFQTLGFDYKMAVTTTDAYLSGPRFRNDPKLAQVRDGAGLIHTGFRYITPAIPNIVGNFVLSASQGSDGSGDERAFSSFLDTLSSPLNADFHRPGAFLAVIILSDEDDFSDSSRPEASWMNGGTADHDYSNVSLLRVSDVVSQLDTFTHSAPTNRQYNVSAIAVTDEACRSQHVKDSGSTIIGQRYIELANATSGIVGSICDQSYATSLKYIQQHLVELASQFQLGRVPNESSIKVTVNGIPVAKDPANGWTYNSTANTIVFHGTAVPSPSASISITFDPAGIR